MTTTFAIIINAALAAGAIGLLTHLMLRMTRIASPSIPEPSIAVAAIAPERTERRAAYGYPIRTVSQLR